VAWVGVLEVGGSGLSRAGAGGVGVVRCSGGGWKSGNRLVAGGGGPRVFRGWWGLCLPTAGVVSETDWVMATRRVGQAGFRGRRSWFKGRGSGTVMWGCGLCGVGRVRFVGGRRGWSCERRK